MSKYGDGFSETVAFCFGVFIGAVMVFMMHVADYNAARERWRDQLVDDPSAVAHIRSVVLAERELKKMKEGK